MLLMLKVYFLDNKYMRKLKKVIGALGCLGIWSAN